ncbi:hypothetical protein EGW08_018311 [Elysia chlorotica]|uniref:Integrase catalytic domain-containing protein n=1 Tax=Elysia chlorotica TaxID=188477 RepID=A0A433SXA9_ELYCH|nr:hypothetical protein EGW08_018311 [Elysia chlorotica]
MLPGRYRSTGIRHPGHTVCPSGLPLHVANGTPIQTYGPRNLHLSFNNRLYLAKLIIANVKRPLLGPPIHAHAHRLHPFGLYEFLRMPFGLKNAAQAFQRLMDTVLQGLNCVFVYLDDILVASSSEEEHIEDVRTVCNRLHDYGLVVKLEKCLFGVKTIDFLGHRITKNGSIPLPSKVKAIEDFPKPSTVKGLQEYLGMLNFYHRFIPHAATLLRPLHNALKKAKPKQIQWTEGMNRAFQSSKTALASATMVSHPMTEAEISMSSDASDKAVGAVLEQPAFFSKQLRPSETKYSTFDRELLGLYLTIRHFRFYLEGRHFTSYTDHKPLVGAMSKLSDPWSARQQRQLSYISEFSTDIRHIAGKTNVVADCLSRTTTDDGYSYLLTIIDRTTRWPEAIPINNTSTTECAKTLIRHWISRFGVPLDMTSDRGPQFTSALWTAIAEKLGTNIHHTCAYHPQSNGLVERFHRSLKAALKARLQGANWVDELHWVLLGLRTVPKEDLETSSAELVYGEPLTVPGEFFHKDAHQSPVPNIPFQTILQKIAPPPMLHHGYLPPNLSPTLKDSHFVFIRRDGHRGPLQRPYDGPFRVITPGDKTFLVIVVGREELISVDRLKPAHVDLTNPVPVSLPPRRGRPPQVTLNPQPPTPANSYNMVDLFPFLSVSRMMGKDSAIRETESFANMIHGSMCVVSWTTHDAGQLGGCSQGGGELLGILS